MTLIRPLLPLAAQSDPFTPYPGMETQSADKGKGGGKGNPHNPVPESGAAGFMLVATVLVLFFLVRTINRWNPVKCGCGRKECK